MTSMTIKRHITKISQNLRVNAAGGTIMDNTYAYDAVSNVLSVANGASLPQSGKAGGQMSHQYTYDALYRLAGRQDGWLHPCDGL